MIISILFQFTQLLCLLLKSYHALHRGSTKSCEKSVAVVETETLNRKSGRDISFAAVVTSKLSTHSMYIDDADALSCINSSASRNIQGHKTTQWTVDQ